MRVERLPVEEPMDFKVKFHNGFGEKEFQINRSDAKRLMYKLQREFL